MTRQNNPKIQTGSGTLFSKTKPKRKTHSKRQRGGDVEEDNELLMASSEGRIDTVKKLLDKKRHSLFRANVDAKTYYKDTALINASSGGHIEIAKVLLDNGAEVNAKNKSGNTALMMASSNGHIDIVRLLLDNRAEMDASNNLGETAHMMANNMGHTDIVTLLLDNGPDVKTIEEVHKGVLSNAQNRVNFLNEKRENNENLKESRQNDLQECKENILKKQEGEKEIFLKKQEGEKEILLKKCFEHINRKYITTPTDNVLKNPDLKGKIAEYLRTKVGGKKGRKTRKNKKKLGRKTRSKKQKGSGANCSRPGQCTTDQNMEEEDPNSIDEYLQLAIEEEDVLRVKEYLEEGADPNVMITDSHQYIQGTETVPAIIYAARHIEPSTILKHLIEHGASVERDEIYTGSTPLIEAGEWGNLPAVKLLLEEGADINATKETGMTAIGYAVLNESIPMIKLMLKEGKGEIDFNYTAFGTDNKNVIDDADENAENPEVAKILKNYANPERLVIPEITAKMRRVTGQNVEPYLSDKIRKYIIGGKGKTRKNHKKK